MTSSEVRSLFIQYFSEQAHEPVSSASLAPINDPSLLFVNAGMVQFKRTFLGDEPRPYVRAVSSQKCVRAGGKHNDLENVGQTARHHTFFEMLGNFSFGDYFKEDAIAFAWELLTERFNLAPEKLWITVYKDDDEAEQLWLKFVSPDRILRLGDKDNFWQMGDVGPCGPCSEVMFDQGEQVHKDCPGIGICDCDRYLEIWNLVFMQYNRDKAGVLSPLPKPSIDTGMGLERMTAVTQGVLSNYETDLFQPLFTAIAKAAKRPEKEVAFSMPGRVIADHVRAITFMASDGIVPANEGRGYVFRRILRRAARYGRQFGFFEPFLYRLTEVLVTQMKAVYPELEQSKSLIKRLVLGEEERFIHTLNHGMQLLDKEIAATRDRGSDLIGGDALFTLYDTYGFPIDLTQEIAEEAGLKLDMAGYQTAMSAQKERARSAWVGGERAAQKQQVNPGYQAVLDRHGKSDFVGYDRLSENTTVVAMFKEGETLTEAKSGDSLTLLFDRTPFYAESGGQVGDVGVAVSDLAMLEIARTTKPLPDLHLHHATVTRGMLRVGDRFQLRVDALARQATARNHTGTHLLHAALRDVLGDHVKQAGSLVSPGRLRFDFQHFAPMTERELDRIETEVNAQICLNNPVQTKIMNMDEAVESGAMALFGEKYGNEVRVVSVGEFSSELCGGTHCTTAGEIALFTLVKEGSVASGVRRIEALTGEAAYLKVKEQSQILSKVSALLKSSPEDLIQKTERLLFQLTEKQQEIERLRNQKQENSKDPLEAVVKVGEVSVLCEKMLPSDMNALRSRADHLRDKLKSGIIVAGAVTPDGEKVAFVVMVTSDFSKQYKAGAIVKKLASIVGGSGGGRPEMAQAGGKDVEKLDEALAASIGIIQSMS